MRCRALPEDRRRRVAVVRPPRATAQRCEQLRKGEMPGRERNISVKSAMQKCGLCYAFLLRGWGHGVASTLLTIGEMAAAYSTTLRTLRFYEAEELLTPARIGTRRLYSSRDRTRLELILAGKRFGFTLTELKKILGAAATTQTAGGDQHSEDLLAIVSREEICRRIRALEKERADLQNAIYDLQTAMAYELQT